MKIPYFEIIVKKIKVEKKVEKCQYEPEMVILSNKYARFKCIKCGEIYETNILSELFWSKKEKKGNWVNNENLDKIKFPVPCSYIDTEDKEKHIGMLNRYVDQYRLYNMEKQNEDNFIDDCTSLGNLIKAYDIHILKGKLILFEEEE